MWVYRGPFGLRTQRTRPRRFRQIPKSTAADVGLSRSIWLTNATITAAPIPTYTEIDCGRCGVIEVH